MVGRVRIGYAIAAHDEDIESAVAIEIGNHGAVIHIVEPAVVGFQIYIPDDCTITPPAGAKRTVGRTEDEIEHPVAVYIRYRSSPEHRTAGVAIPDLATEVG